MEREYFIPIHTDGILTKRDLVRDCHRRRWLPLLALRPTGQPQATPVIPVLNNGADCRDWCKRNLPKHWVKGHYALTEDRLHAACEVNGWTFEVYPSYKRLPKDVELWPEVLDVSHEDNIQMLGNVGDAFYSMGDPTDIADLTCSPFLSRTIRNGGR